jgi:hypothetical protein
MRLIARVLCCDSALQPVEAPIRRRTVTATRRSVTSATTASTAA